MGNLYYKNQSQKNCGTSSWSIKELLIIRMWQFVWLLLFRPTPKFMNFWRIVLLRIFGAHITGHVFVASSARIYAPFNLTCNGWVCIGPHVYLYDLGKIKIESGSVLSEGTVLCGGSHDLSVPNMPLMVGDIEIAEGAFLGMNAFVLPGLKIGKSAVVGAMAVVTKDVASLQIVAGNPARVVGERHFK